MKYDTSVDDEINIVTLVYWVHFRLLMENGHINYSTIRTDFHEFIFFLNLLTIQNQIWRRFYVAQPQHSWLFHQKNQS